MGEVVYGVDFRRGVPDPDYPNLPQNFCEAYKAVRHELASLVPFAKSGGPIADHSDYPEPGPAA